MLNSSFDIFTKIQLSNWDCVAGAGGTIIKNILPHTDISPNQKITNYDIFFEAFIDGGCLNHQSELDCAASFNTKVSNDISIIYAVLEYPADQPAVFKFETNNIITYGVLLYAHIIAYQLLCALEKDSSECTHEMVNPDFPCQQCARMYSTGVSDLCYNGDSQIIIYDSYIVCKFNCDS